KTGRRSGPPAGGPNPDRHRAAGVRPEPGPPSAAGRAIRPCKKPARRPAHPSATLVGDQGTPGQRLAQPHRPAPSSAPSAARSAPFINAVRSLRASSLEPFRLVRPDDVHRHPALPAERGLVDVVEIDVDL